MAITQTENFIDRLKQSDNPFLLCEKEKEYLDVNYQGLPTRKKSYSEYRKVIVDSSLSDAEKEKYTQVFALSKEQYADYKNDYKRKVAKEHDNQKPLYNHKKYIEKAISLLDCKSYPEQVIGFAALTGRRLAEIGCTAEFSIVSSDELMFKGQLKLKDKTPTLKPYKIPVLANSFTLMKKFDLFREKYKTYIGNPKKFHNNNSRYISEFTKKHLKQFVEKDIQGKDLRAIYAEIAASKFKSIEQTKQRYFALILGHSEDDLVTCNSYFDFRLCDEQKL